MRIWLTAIGVAAIAAGCQREERELRIDPPVQAALDQALLMPNGTRGQLFTVPAGSSSLVVSVSAVSPGGATLLGIGNGVRRSVGVKVL